MSFWSRAFLTLGALLTLIGAVPAVLAAVFWPSLDSPIPGLLSLSLAPLGLFLLGLGVLFLLAGLLRRR